MENIKNLRKYYPSLNIQIFHGIRDENGARGCLRSHQALIRMAKEQGRPYIWVIEDDCRFLVNNGILAAHARSVIDYLTENNAAEIVNGCGNLMHPDVMPVSRRGDVIFVRGREISTTHCMFYGSKSYDAILSIDEGLTLDSRGGTNSCQMLFTYPYLATQLPTYSDIEKKEVEYELIARSSSHTRAVLALHNYL